jgi:hypothetical protein
MVIESKHKEADVNFEGLRSQIIPPEGGIKCGQDEDPHRRYGSCVSPHDQDQVAGGRAAEEQVK